MQAFAYSFKDVTATINGPGGNFSIGAGAGVASEGISFEPSEDKNTMLTGADGNVVHSLNPVTAGKLTVRLLKNSPTNALLMQMYETQAQSALFWGQNTIIVKNPVSGDEVSCRQVAFHRNPPNTWAKEANVIDWEFDAAKVHQTLGAGSLLAAAAAIL